MFGSDVQNCWSHWPRGLRRRSAAACQLRWWVWIPSGSWISLCCECCVLSGRGLFDELITRPEESCRLWCVVCDLETSWMRRPRPIGGWGAAAPKERKKKCSEIESSPPNGWTCSDVPLKYKRINLKCFNRNVWRQQWRMFMRYLYAYLTYAIRKTACKCINDEKRR